eukprot:s2096_g3.t1
MFLPRSSIFHHLSSCCFASAASAVGTGRGYDSRRGTDIWACGSCSDRPVIIQASLYFLCQHHLSLGVDHNLTTISRKSSSVVEVLPTQNSKRNVEI